ncbi:MAG: hypothetical protein HYX48_02095 [Chlamydiales bacterium]|nr:hypothetical protein [Chlamydiales bacterium]
MSAGSATSLGAGAGAKTEVQGLSTASSSQESFQFDLIVFPKVVCRLFFEVIKFKQSACVKKGDWCKWEVASQSIGKPTTLHVTVPGSATSVKFVVHTDGAQNTSQTIFRGEKIPFSARAIEVIDNSYAGQTKNGIIDHSNGIDAARKALPKDAAEQTIVVDPVRHLTKTDPYAYDKAYWDSFRSPAERAVREMDAERARERAAASKDRKADSDDDSESGLGLASASGAGGKPVEEEVEALADSWEGKGDSKTA